MQHWAEKALIHNMAFASESELRNLRSSRSEAFFKIGVLKSFAIFTGKHQVLGSLF